MSRASVWKPYDHIVSKRAVRVSLAIVGGFFLVEATGGWLTNSLALLADAGHLLTDVGALTLALLVSSRRLPH